MSFSLRQTAGVWFVTACFAVVGAFWLHLREAERVERITALGGGDSITADSRSLTGYTHGVRRLIVPAQHNESYQWIVQTQGLLARGEWRVRHVDYDNAPMGRALPWASPFRWWLAGLAKLRAALAQEPIGRAVEWAAIWSGPLLHLAWAVGLAVVFTMWWGVRAGAIGALGVSLAPPLERVFEAGRVDDASLALLVASSGVALLARAGASSTRAKRGCFFGAGLLGAAALWMGGPIQHLVTGGIVLSALVTAVLIRALNSDGAKSGAVGLPPWRWWGGGAGLGVVLACLVDYVGANAGEAARVTPIQPWHAVAWLGLGELLWHGSRWVAWRQRPTGRVSIAGALLGAALFLAGLIVGGAHGFLLAPSAGGLLPGTVADGFAGLSVADGLTMAGAAGLLAGVAAGGWWLWQMRRRAEGVWPLAMAWMPLAVVTVWTLVTGRGWELMSALLAVFLVVAWAASDRADSSPAARWIGVGVLALLLVPGLGLRARSHTRSVDAAVSAEELPALIGRDLAYWLAQRTGPTGAIVLAPPTLTTSCYFHGGLRGLVTADPANADGFAAAVRIASATSQDEALALIERRRVTHIILPSWDPALDEYARLGSKDPEKTLVALLHRWLPPRWLRPVAYPLPKIPGFEDQTVVLFEVVELQDNATALGHLAEYFTELGQPDHAGAVEAALRSEFPTDLGALAASAHVRLAQSDGRGFDQIIERMVVELTRGADEALPWDRRVSVVLILARAGRVDLAAPRLEALRTSVTETGLRGLSPTALFRLMSLLKAAERRLEDPALESIAHSLLPAELAGRL